MIRMHHPAFPVHLQPHHIDGAAFQPGAPGRIANENMARASDAVLRERGNRVTAGGALHYRSQGEMAWEPVVDDAFGFDGIERASHAPGIQSDLANDACLGDHLHTEPVLLRDPETDEVFSLSFRQRVLCQCVCVSCQ
jgi:hypothetical protein